MSTTREEAELKLRAGWKTYAERFADGMLKTYPHFCTDPEGSRRAIIADCMRQAGPAIQAELDLLFGDRVQHPLPFIDSRKPEERL